MQQKKPVSPKPVKVIDWKESKLRELLLIPGGDVSFNPERDSSIFREDEIEYTINMLRFNAKDFRNTNMIQPLFGKALLTLQRLMSDKELGIPHLYDRM